MEVKVIERKQASGNKTLYLEYYETGFRKRENLHLTIYPEDGNAKLAKINKETRHQAEVIRSERILNPPSWLFKDPEEDAEEHVDERTATLTWVQWALDYAELGRQEGNVRNQVLEKQAVAKKIKHFLKLRKLQDILLKDVKTEHISDLYKYMREKYRNPKQIKNNGGHLSDFSLMLFGQTINAMFNKAVREQIIGYNPVGGLDKLERFHIPDTHREFLTIDELERFLAVETATEPERNVQKAFGFASMTGLRLCDMRRLSWCHIKPMGDGLCVHMKQQKTKQWVTVPLNDKALSLLPPKPEVDDGKPIFKFFKKNDSVTMYVRRIKEKAGIEEKDVTFHCSRHTIATLAMAANADISTVRDILGQKSTVSTQVYAKVSLESKMEIVNLTNGLFD